MKPFTRQLVIVESPYAANTVHTIDDHLIYLRKCLRHSWEQGELPFASHGFFPLFLNEHDPEERKAGIEAGYQFWHLQIGSTLARPTIAFYCDLGISNGMKAALNRCSELSHPFAIRNIL